MKILFPGFLKKALTFSYDDNNTQDRRLTEIFRKYGLSATFNINTGSFGQRGHIDDHFGFYCEYNRIEESEVRELYKGFEIASHTVDHILLPEVDSETFDRQVIDDCLKIEELCGTRAVGLAYPCGVYDDKTAEHLSRIGIIYARTIKDTHGFSIPESFLKWHPTCHDHDPMVGEITDAFLKNGTAELRLLYIWGHAFEFDKNDTDRWADMEALCRKLSGKNDIWYATNREICEYITAARAFKESGVNNSGIDLFADIDGDMVVIHGN